MSLGLNERWEHVNLAPRNLPQDVTAADMNGLHAVELPVSFSIFEHSHLRNIVAINCQKNNKKQWAYWGLKKDMRFPSP